MALNYALLLFSGLFIGIAASFTGLGGGFLMVPLLIAMGYTAQKAVGTSFLAILIISASAVFAHSKFSNVDFKIAIALGLGGTLKQNNINSVESIQADVNNYDLTMLGRAK